MIWVQLYLYFYIRQTPPLGLRKNSWSVIYCPDLVVNIKLAVDKQIVGFAAESVTKIKKFYVIDSWWHFNSETILGAGFFRRDFVFFCLDFLCSNN
jgi:hypothetical protein